MDPEIQQAVRISESKDLKSALLYAMKVETAQQATRRDHQLIQGALEQDSLEPLKSKLEELEMKLEKVLKSDAGTKDQNPMLRCWYCGKEGHLRRTCPGLNKGDDNSHQRNQRLN